MINSQINPLAEIPPAKMKLYGISWLDNSVFFETEKERDEYMRNKNIFLDSICTIEYINNFAGRKDVIKETDKNGSYILYTAIDEDGYGVYNSMRSLKQGSPVWEYNYGDLRSYYSAFRDKGIIFENDIYAQIDKRYQQPDKEIKKLGLFPGNKN